MISNFFEKFREIEMEEFNTPLSSLNLSEIKFFSPSTLIEEIIEYSQIHNVTTFAIGEGSAEGLITENELLKFIGCDYDTKKNNTLGDALNSSLFHLDINDSIKDTILTMGAKKINHLLIKDGEKLRVVLLKNLLQFTADRFEKDLNDYEVKIHWSDNGVYLQERTHFDELSEGLLNLTTHIFETPIRKVMFNEAIFCDVNSNLSEAIGLMNRESVSSIILMEYETEMKGILTAKDIVNKGYGKVDLKNFPVSEIMTAAPHKLLEQDILAVAIKNMSKFKYRSVLICNQVGYPISIVSILEILNFICSKLKSDELDKG